MLLEQGRRRCARVAPRGDGAHGRRLHRGGAATGRSPSREADGRRLRGAQAAVPTGAYPIRKPRIAMYQRYGGGNMDEGWTRLMFEQFNVPYKSIMDAEIKAGGLESKYDVIVLPADSVAAMTGERPPPAARRAGGGRGGGGFGGGRRQHAGGVSQRLRRRGREGAAGVRAEGRHARHVRRRRAICRFSASACRSATSSPGCRRRSSGRRDRRCA